MTKRLIEDMEDKERIKHSRFAPKTTPKTTTMRHVFSPRSSIQDRYLYQEPSKFSVLPQCQSLSIPIACTRTRSGKIGREEQCSTHFGFSRASSISIQIAIERSQGRSRTGNLWEDRRAFSYYFCKRSRVEPRIASPL